MSNNQNSATIIKPQLVIFDMDGLIFDTENLFFRMKSVALEGTPYTNTREDYISTLGLGGEHLIEALKKLHGEDYPYIEINKKIRELCTDYIETNGPDVKDGIAELLTHLKANNISCCVASSSHSPYVAKYLEKANLSSYFDFLIGGEMVSHSKPEPDIFLLACEKAGIAPADALVLEDSEHGILASFNAGIPCICIPDMKYPGDDYASKATAILNSADELIELLS